MGIFTLASAAINKTTSTVKEVVLHTDGERVINTSKRALSKVGITGVSDTLEKGLNACSVVEGAVYKGIGTGFRAIKEQLRRQEELHHASIKKEEEPTTAVVVFKEDK